MATTMTTKGISKKELLNLFERLSIRADMLPDEQRTFVRLFLAGGKYRPIANSAGVNEVTIARRLKKIADRISSNNFIAALSGNNNLPPEKMEILKDRFVNGMAVKTIAQNRNISYYKVRKIIKETEVRKQGRM
jgi:DNA invertase Pin-like site-specific DNA recombinase